MKNKTWGIHIAWTIGIMGIGLLLSCQSAQQDVQHDAHSDADLVLIPGGTFLMGAEGESDDNPAHTVTIDSFYIATREITNAQYFRFCRETGHTKPAFWGIDEFHSGPDFPSHPVVGVSSGDAKAYAEWAGMRLPTEAEWEYAARGGLTGQHYPHGNDLDSTLANFSLKGITRGTVPVGRYPANGFGLHDAAGNVWEWVSDRYQSDYYQLCPADNPKGPDTGRFKVIRGGGWHSGPYCNRVYFRNGLPPGWVDFAVGFRCAKDVK